MARFEEVEAQTPRGLRKDVEEDIEKAGRLQEESRPAALGARDGRPERVHDCLSGRRHIVIYLVEQNPLWEPKVSARIAAFRAAGDEIAVSDAARLECLIGPFQTGNAADLASYAVFFASSSPRMLPVTVAVWERAARIRATHGFSALDALHLATAVEHGCTRFLSNDAQLKRFPDITVEVL